MITEEEIKSYKKQLKSGIPEGEIKNEMLTKGFDENDIQLVFKNKNVDMRSWYLTFSLIIFFVSLFSLKLIK